MTLVMVTQAAAIIMMMIPAAWPGRCRPSHGRSGLVTRHTETVTDGSDLPRSPASQHPGPSESAAAQATVTRTVPSYKSAIIMTHDFAVTRAGPDSVTPGPVQYIMIFKFQVQCPRVPGTPRLDFGSVRPLDTAIYHEPNSFTESSSDLRVETDVSSSLVTVAAGFGLSPPESVKIALPHSGLQVRRVVYGRPGGPGTVTKPGPSRSGPPLGRTAIAT
jgi:hypothetical protein